uniref:C2H2-type domain-containing protein n=1 Tax=Amphilophus citrinellus TaxID=61819 RepID=A0A3Q0RCV8_AMPCI
MELLQKGEEVAQLKIKLQRAELKLKDLEEGTGRQVETNKAQTNPLQTDLEVAMETSGQTSEIPEIDFEGIILNAASLLTKYVFRLALWFSNLNETTKPSKDKKLPVRDQKVQCQPLRNKVKLLLRDIKEEYPDLIMPDRLRRRPNLAGRKQETKVKCKTDQRKSAATKSTSKEQETVEHGSRNVYSCKICKKMFDTEFGRSVHERSHKKCREAANTAQTPSDEEETCAPNEKHPVNKKSTPSKNNNHQAHKNAGRYTCTFCSKTFDFRFKFIAHMRIHTGEKPYSCSICPKKFRIAQSLQVHMVRRHNNTFSLLNVTKCQNNVFVKAIKKV